MSEPLIQFLPAFNAGEMSPLMDARVGLDKYMAGCRTLKNFIPVPFGGVSKRPGTIYLDEVANHSRKTRLAPFKFAVDAQYILELGHFTLRFFHNRTLLTNVGEFAHVEAWKTATSYPNGAVVIDGTSYWRTTAEHTAHASNKFQAVPWRNVSAIMTAWTVGTAYSAGAVVWRQVTATDRGFYEARTTHTATAKNGPVAATNAAWFRITLASVNQWDFASAYTARNGIISAYARTMTSVADTIQASYERTGTTVTINKVGHGFLGNDAAVDLRFITGGALTGIYTVASVPDADHFTVTTAASGAIALSQCSYAVLPRDTIYSRAGNLITVFENGHPRQVGDIVRCGFDTGNPTDGTYVVESVPDANTWRMRNPVSGTIAQGPHMFYSTVQLWQCLIAHTSDLTNEPGGTPPWQTATPGPVDTLSVVTPWTEDEVFDLQFQQINDIMVICHPDHVPHVLRRTHEDFFTLAPMEFDWPPLRDENIEGSIKLTPSNKTGNITLTASGDVFEPLHVGAQWALAWAAANRSVELRIQKTTVETRESAWLLVAGRWNAYSHMYWDGVFEIHRSFDRGENFEVIRSYKAANGDRNFNTSGEEARECMLRLKFIGKRFAFTGGANYDARGYIEIIDHREWGRVEITAVTNPRTALATVVGSLPYSTSTHLWAEGAWSDQRGFPRSVVLHAGRLWFGGSASEPMRLWATVTDDFFNFRRSSLADGSIATTIASVAMHAIQWLASGADSLLVGTQGKEYVIKGLGDAPLGPGNVTAQPQSAYGSAYLPAILVNYVTLFVQRSRLGVREFVFSLERNGFIAADMTKLASHIVNPGIRQWDFQQAFNAIVWAITGDGKLVGMTYEREENVVGWHRHETDGDFESVAILYGPEGSGDEIYLVVKRTIDGVEKRFVELIQPDAFERQRDSASSLPAGETYDENQAECVMSDSAIVLRGTFAAGALLDIPHLEGKTVQVLADGAKRNDAVVDNGKITLADAASVVIVGLPYEALLQPMKANIDMRNGSGQTRGWKLHRLAIRVYQSLGGEFRADDGAEWQRLRWRDTDDPMGVAPPLFTGEKEDSASSRTGESLDFMIRSNDPHPLTIVALAPKFSVEGDQTTNRK